MTLPQFHEVLADPKFRDAPAARKREINDAYWSAYDKENPDDAWGKQVSTDARAALEASEKLESAAPITRRALELQRDAANVRLKVGVADKQGLWSSPEERSTFLQQRDAEVKQRQESLKKTFSLFDPEVDKEMQPTWNALQKTALESGYFGDRAVSSTGMRPEQIDSKRSEYQKYRDTVAKDFNLAPDEVDDLVKHRMGAQKELISRDALGGLHIKDELLVRGNEDIQKAITESTLPDKVKSDLSIEAPQRLALFKTGVVENVKKQHPELAAEIKWTGDVQKDYTALTSVLNNTKLEQFGSGVKQPVLERVASAALGALTSPVTTAGGGLLGTELSREEAQRQAFYTTPQQAAKRTESINQLSNYINQEKVRILGVDAATVGAGVYSGVESIVIGAVTGGLGTAAISADRIKKAGTVGKILLGGAQRGLNTAPIATIYGVEQGLDTYERTGDVGKSLLSAAIEGGVTTVFGAIKLGGTEDLGQRLANPAVRESLGKSVGKAWRDFGVDVGKTVTGEQLEELTITALNDFYVESKLNPGMTVADMKKNLWDTAVSTLFASGPMGAITSAREQGTNLFKSTHEQTDTELHDTADALAKAAAKESIPQAEATGGTVTPPSDAGVAPREQFTREEFASALADRHDELLRNKQRSPEEDAELAGLEDRTLDAIAAERNVDLIEESQEPLEAAAEPGGDVVAEMAPESTLPTTPTTPTDEKETQGQGLQEVAPALTEDRGAPQARAVVSSLLTPEARNLPPENFQQQKVASPEQVSIQNKVAKLYDALPEDDSSNPEVVQAYENLTTEVLEQHKAMLGSGLKIELVEENPYKSSKEMVEDVKRGNLKVQRTDAQTFGSSPDVFQKSNHPMLKDSGFTDINGKPLLVNDVFRGVHDYIAHAAFGSTFGPLGEEAAWKAHLATIKDPLARRALTTETRGQNSWVNYRDEMIRDGQPTKKGDPGYVAPQDRPFAVQKFALLPEEALEEAGAAPAVTVAEAMPADVPEKAPDLIGLTDAILSVMGITREEASTLTGETLTPEPAKVDAKGQMLLFQNPEATGDPAASKYVQSFKGSPPKGATRTLLDYAGDELLLGGDLGDLPASTVKDIKEANDLIQQATGKKGRVRVGRIGFNNFLFKLWKRHHRGKSPGWHNFQSRRDVREMGKILSFEVAHALSKDGSGVDWYNSKIAAMYDTLAKSFPELGQDTEGRFLFSVILAATSNGQAVLDNLTDTIKIYQSMRGQSKLPTNVTTSRSERTAAVNNAFRDINTLLADKGWAEVKAEMLEELTVSELKKRYGQEVTGEHSDHVVIGAMMMGPKIGSFWGNLNGHYDSITMDLWFTRTINRLTGDTATINPEKLSEVFAELAALPGLSPDVKRDIAVFKAALKKGDNWTRVPSDIREEVEFLYDFAKKTYSLYASSGFKDRSSLNKTVQKIIKELDGGEDTPDNGAHRKWMRAVVKAAQDQLRANGVNITNADLQAILWFHEKDLYTRFGATSTRGERTDYADAAAPALSRATRTTDSAPAGSIASDAGRAASAPTGQVQEQQLSLFQRPEKSGPDPRGTIPKFRNKIVRLTHWSFDGSLKKTDPKKHGKGGAGEELKRQRAYPDIYQNRTYVGFGTYKKEDQVGPHRYSIEVDGNAMYDYKKDPLDLYPSGEDLRAAGQAPFDQQAAYTLYEKRIREAGFLGYVHTAYSAGVLFEPATVSAVEPGNKSLPVDTGKASPTAVLKQDSEGPKGQVTFVGLSKALIQYFESADGSTAAHEPLHIARRFLLNRNIRAEKRVGITDEMIDAANDFVGATDSNWSVEQEEKFARAFERYLWEGTTTGVAAVDSLLDRIKNFMRDIYQNIKGSSLDIQLTAEIRQLFDSLITRGETLKEKGVAPTPIAIEVKARVKAKPAPAPAPVKKPARKLPDLPKPQSRSTSIKNAETDKYLVQNGMAPMLAPARQSNEDTWDKAMAIVEARPKAGDYVVNSILNSERSVSSEVEEGVLLHELAVRKAEVARQRNAVIAAHGNEDAVREAQGDLKKAQSELIQSIIAAKLAGTAWGRIGQFRQRAIAEDFSLEAMEARFAAEINDGAPLTTDQSRLIAVLQKRIAEAEARTAEAEAEIGLKEREVQALLKKLEEKKPRAPVERRGLTERVVEKAQTARERLMARGFGTRVLEQAAEKKTDEEIRKEAGFYKFTDNTGKPYEIVGGVGKVFKVIDNGKVVATLRYREAEEGIVPTSVNVDPAYRRRGIASYLYDHAELITGKDILKGDSLTEEGSKFRQKYNAGGWSDSALARQRSVQEKEKRFFRIKRETGTRLPVMSVFAANAVSRIGTGHKSRSVVVEMSIDDFLRYALPLSGEQRQRARESFSAGIKWESVPSLFLDDADPGKARISGHEGRHRALVLKEAGYTTIPVEIRSMVVRWSEQNDPKEYDYRETLPTSVKSEDGKSILPYPANRESYAQQKEVLRKLSGEQTQTLRQDPELTSQDIEDLGDVLASEILKGTSEDEAIDKLIEEFGSIVGLHTDGIIDAARGQLAKTAAGSRAKTPTELFNMLDPENPEISNKLVFNMVRGFINQDVPKEKVLKKVLKVLQQKFPDLTYDELSDIFTGYGKVKFPSQEEDLKAVRELRNIERIKRQIAELEAGNIPKKTGQQRDAATARIRELQKELKEAFRAAGIKHTTSATQLKGALDAIKTRLKNELEDLDRAIATNTRITRKKTQVEYDEEIKALQKRRDARRAEYDKLFGVNRKAMTDAQRLKATIKALNKRITEERELANKGLVDRINSSSKPVSNTEIESLRATLAGLVEARTKARAALYPSMSEEDRAAQRAETTSKRLVEYYQKILAGLPTDKRSPVSFTPSEELAKLITLKEDLKSAVKEMRKKARIPFLKTKEERSRNAALKALERSVADLEARVLRGDLSPRTRAAKRTDLPAELVKRQKTAQEALNALRGALLPTKEERREQALIRAATTRRKKIEARIAAGDYVKVERVTPVMSTKLAAARLAESRAKQEWNQGFFEKQLAERSFGKKTYDTTAEILNFTRTMKTISDVSAVLRQGMVTMLSRPVLSLKAIPGMFRAGFSEVQHQRIKDEIEAHPLFGLSQQAKLFIADTGPDFTLSKIEEAFRGRWAKQVPGLKTVVGFSERTYNAYLNQVRMASFANMVEGFTGGKPTVKEAKVIADFVNRATGRGDLKNFESSAAGLAAAFFSPKFVVSRFQIIWGAVPALYTATAGYYLQPKDVRRAKVAVAKEYARLVIGIAAVYGLAALAKAGFGDDDAWELDPRSTKFGKVKIGTTLIDPMGGLLQAFTFGMRMLPTRNNGVWRPYAKTGKGDIVSLWRPGFGKQSYVGTMGQFLRTKLSPVPSSIINVMQGEDVVGQAVTIRSEAIGSVVPLVFGDVFETLRENGVQGTPLAVAVMFGMGVRTDSEELELEQWLSTFAGVNPQEYERKKASDSRGGKLQLQMKTDSVVKP